MKKIKIKKTDKCDTRTLKKGEIVTEKAAREDTEAHIEAVQKCGQALMGEFYNQLKIHDHTKLDHLKEFTEGLNKGFDSPEFTKWYDMHVKSERHHLLKRVPDDVNLIDVLEMICDCVSAGMARTGKVFDINIPEEVLVKATKNTFKLLVKNIEVED